MKKIIQLPLPNKNVAMSLFEALQNRHSSRDFGDEAIDDQTLSQLLWAAYGINRPNEKKRTAPSAMNLQSVSIYVYRNGCAYLWNEVENTLIEVCNKDIRDLLTNGQGNIGNFSIALILVADNARFDTTATLAPIHWVSLDAALISQNVNLAATALGLNNVPRVNMDTHELKKALNLSATQFPVMNNLVGHQ